MILFRDEIIFFAVNSNGLNSSLLEELKDEESHSSWEEMESSEKRGDEMALELLQEGRIRNKERNGKNISS